MPALIKVQPTGQSQQIFLNAKNIFKLGAIFWENAQCVCKIFKAAKRGLTLRVFL